MAAEAGAQQAAAARKEAKSLRLQLAERDTCMAAVAAELATLLADTALGVPASGRAPQEVPRAVPAAQQGPAAALSGPQRRKRLDAICRRLASYGRAPEPLEPCVQQEVRHVMLYRLGHDVRMMGGIQGDVYGMRDVMYTSADTCHDEFARFNVTPRIVLQDMKLKTAATPVQQ